MPGIIVCFLCFCVQLIAVSLFLEILVGIHEFLLYETPHFLNVGLRPTLTEYWGLLFFLCVPALAYRVQPQERIFWLVDQFMGSVLILWFVLETQDLVDSVADALENISTLAGLVNDWVLLVVVFALVRRSLSSVGSRMAAQLFGKILGVVVFLSYFIIGFSSIVFLWVGVFCWWCQLRHGVQWAVSEVHGSLPAGSGINHHL